MMEAIIIFINEVLRRYDYVNECRVEFRCPVFVHVLFHFNHKG